MKYDRQHGSNKMFSVWSSDWACVKIPGRQHWAVSLFLKESLAHYGLVLKIIQHKGYTLQRMWMLCNDWKTLFKFKLFKSIRRNPLWMTRSADTLNWHTIAFSSPTLRQTPTRRVNKPDEAETHWTHGSKWVERSQKTDIIFTWYQLKGKNLHKNNSTRKKKKKKSIF